MPRRLLLALLCGFSLIIICACSDDPADVDLVPDTSIRGQVLDNTGQPVADAAILLCYDIPGHAPGAKPTTVISFDMPTAGSAELYISDPCTGAIVRELLSDDMIAGHHSIAWTGNDTLDNDVVSGFYTYHLTVDDAETTRDFFLPKYGYTGFENAEGLNTFAQTDENGRFSFSQDCLAFNYEVADTDENGDPVETITVPNTVTLWAIHENYGATSSPSYLTVSPNEGLTVELVFGN